MNGSAPRPCTAPAPRVPALHLLLLQLFLLPILLVGAACAPTRDVGDDTPPPAVEPPPTTLPPSLQGTNVFCSDAEPRLAGVRLAWPGKEAADDRGVAFTAVKDGFERDLTVAIRPATPRTEPQLSEAARKAAAAAAPLADLRVARADGLVEVVGLEAGIVYYVRLLVREGDAWTPVETVRVEAPTCIADYVDRN